MRAAVWRRLDASHDAVALTLDDCDDAAAWRRILDVLAEHRAPATFFPNGIRVEEMPELARRTVEDGHAIGSHGYDHARPTDLGGEELRWRLERDAELWRAVASASPRPWFRPAYGELDDRIADAAAAAGYPRIAMWDVDPMDWQVRDHSVIADVVLRETRPGSIVLLHATAETATALPPILAGLGARGLCPAPLPAGG